MNDTTNTRGLRLALAAYLVIFAALVAATLFISFTSFELYRESIPRLVGGETPDYQNVPWAVAVLVGSMLVAAWPLVSLFR